MEDKTAAQLKASNRAHGEDLWHFAYYIGGMNAVNRVNGATNAVSENQLLRMRVIAHDLMGGHVDIHPLKEHCNMIEQAQESIKLIGEINKERDRIESQPMEVPEFITKLAAGESLGVDDE